MSVAEIEARESSSSPGRSGGSGARHCIASCATRARSSASSSSASSSSSRSSRRDRPVRPATEDLALADGCCPGPSRDHWLGVDELGRDELSRVIYGARYSLLIGVVAVGVGLSIGSCSARSPATSAASTDWVIMRVMDIMLAIPGLLMAIGIVACFGAGLLPVMIAIGVVNIPIFARLLRGSILAQRETDYVLAARASACRTASILATHILPNAISPVIVAGALALATAIIDAAGSGSSASARRIRRRPSGGRCYDGPSATCRLHRRSSRSSRGWRS